MSFTCGCQSTQQPKEPSFKKSKYFEDIAASFAINTKYQQLYAHYSWLVEGRREIPGNAYIEAELHNPADFSNPLKVQAIELKAQDGESPWANRRFYVLSPRLETLTCGLHPVKLTIYKDSTKSAVIGTHENSILSRIDTQYCMKDEFMEKMKLAAKAQEWKSLNPAADENQKE
ncbi:hypothetical protein DFQ27_009246 [Actinomortierella ambigua]|uniref:Uncharacterized protein n=1 Tax=Actinomortierella ambigua TaxID=1343610 RepID=A0A9P6QJ37_9FUNG|nr:hypothetical protein DFQ26_006075 [Actinomortierella ambigua]KAG0266969.1 hypothetical protein DFQ27_009246 [Actinomortierella ambigua]